MYNYGNIILGHINEDYATAGVDLLKIMIISSFFVSFNFIYFSIKRIQKDVYGLVIISGANFVLLILLSYLFMDYFGLIGIGYAWVISYLVGSIFIFIMAKRENWI
jgi:Na+-driven multidrug efflux pump